MSSEHIKHILNIENIRNLLLKVENTKFEELVRKLLDISLKCATNEYAASQATQTCCSLLKMKEQCDLDSTQEFNQESFVMIESMMKDLENMLKDSNNEIASQLKQSSGGLEDPLNSKKIVIRSFTKNPSHESSSSSSVKRKALSEGGPPSMKAKSSKVKHFVKAASDDPVHNSSSSSDVIESSSTLDASDQLLNKSLSSTRVKLEVKTHGEIAIVKIPDLSDLDEEPVKQPKIYQLIKNIGFTISTNDGGKILLYKCFFPNCPFFMQDAEAFAKHLTSNHLKERWNGFCNVCHGIVGQRANYSIFEEMNHMEEKHIKKSVVLRTKVSRECPPLVKIESLPSLPSSELKIYLEKQPVKLRSWLKAVELKNGAVTIMMMQDNCLAAPFKCMDKNCIFFTSDETIFIDHLKLHKEKNLQQGSNECAYCDGMFDKPSSLVKHITVHHNFDVFQCSFCFYRSASFINVQNHIRHYHPKRSTVVIEIMPGSKADSGGVLKTVKKKIHMDRFVRPIPCFVCSDKVFVFEKYQEHVGSHDQEKLLMSKCSKCDESTPDVEKILLHLEKCFNIALHQCLWCNFGSSSIEALNLHYADNHSTKLPFYCTRTSKKKVDVKLSSSLTVELLKNDLEDVIIIRKNITLPSIVNAKNFESLDYFQFKS